MKRSSDAARVVLVLLAAIAAAAPGLIAQTADPPAGAPAGGRVRTSRQETYAVNARIRPLYLFWIGRRDVGEGRIRWHEGPSGERIIDLLVGTDPDRAPRRINRWGFVSELVAGDRLEIVGLMTASDEATLEEAKARVEQAGPLTTYKASKTTIVGRAGTSRITSFAASADLTYRDLEAILTRPESGLSTDRPVVRDSATTTGFLFALETLVQSVQGACLSGAGDVKKPEPAVYLYNQSKYALALQGCGRSAAFEAGGESFPAGLDTRFVITNLTTRTRTYFTVTYGASGRYVGVPLRAVFRPNWWLEIELVHRSGATPPMP